MHKNALIEKYLLKINFKNSNPCEKNTTDKILRISITYVNSMTFGTEMKAIFPDVYKL